MLPHVLTLKVRVVGEDLAPRPAAIWPTIMPTVTRVPWMQIIPPMTAGR